MIRKIAAIFKKPTTRHHALNLKKTQNGSGEYGLDIFDEYSQRLPGFPLGIPVVPVDLLIERNMDMIKEIILARGFAGAHNKDEVERKVMSPVRHLAEMTHLLPASEKNHFKLVGGLFSFCLEVSLFSIRYAERRILTRATPEIRREEESLWAHAAFLNGLFSEAVTAISKISVYAEDMGIEWRPGSESLYDWLVNNDLQRYHIRWNEMEDRSTVYIMAGKSIQKEQTAIFAAGEKAIYKTLYAALQDQKDHGNPLANIVDTVRYKIMERDEWSYADRYGKPLAGMHLEPWLIDAMRHLVQKKRWVPNEDNGRIWHGKDGVFLVWPLAAIDMQYQLKAAECPFIPSTQEILAEILLDAGIIEKNSVGGYSFEIAVPVADSKDKKSLEALKLTRHEVLFVKKHHKPLDEDLQIPNSEDGEDAKNREQSTPEIKQVHSPASPEDEGDATPASTTFEGGTEDAKVNLYDDEYAAGYQSPEDKDYSLFSNASLDSPSASADAQEYRPNKASTTGPDQPMDADEDVESLIGALLSKPQNATVNDQDAKSKNRTNSPMVMPSEANGLNGVIGNKPQPSMKSTGRVDLVLSRLKTLPNEYLSVMPGGVTKVMAKGLPEINLELNDCIALLKSAGLIELVDGRETGLTRTGKGTSRHFVIKANLLDGQ